MRFTYANWKNFCKTLFQNGIQSKTAADVLNKKNGEKYLVLKHDVETNVKKAFKISQIETAYGHKASYYVQAYLINNKKNVSMLKKMSENGHEISYHYDVMDSNKGDIKKAMAEFNKNKVLFEQNGFNLFTVCQHGNPLVNRVGYSSNRDFFRNSAVKKTYPQIADIMVDFKEKANTDYLYFSDAGRKFKLIFDPINNDIIPSDDKNIDFESFNEIFKCIEVNNCIISTHPHRWERFGSICEIKSVSFKIIKKIAKYAFQVPFLQKIMSRYYYLSKKI